MVELFPFINNCFTKDDKVTSEANQTKEPYMVSRFLSMHPASLSAAIRVNEVASRIPKWAVNIVLFTLVKERTPPRINYIKRASKKDNTVAGKKRELAIAKLGEELGLNNKHAESTFKLLEEQNVDVQALYGI